RGERVDLVQRNTWDEPAMEREFLPDRWQRFTLEKISRVLGGAARGLTVRAFRHPTLVAEHHHLLRAGELGRGEAEPCDPLQLGHECVEAPCHAIVRDERLENRLVPRPRRGEQLTIRGGP